MVDPLRRAQAAFEAALNGRPPGDGDAAEPEEDRAAWKAVLPEPEQDIPLPEPEAWPAPPGEDVYHGPAGEVVRLIAPETEADPLAVLAQILVMFGNAIGRKAFWPVEADRHYGNLFAVLVGETAVGRKGVSKGRALSAFQGVQGWAPQCLATGLSSGEGLIWAVRDPVYKVHHVKQRGRVVDTQNVLEDNGVADKRLLVVEPEFASPLRVMQRDGNTLSARIREAWDDGNLRSLTKNSQARATGAHISIIGHCTRKELVQTLDQVSGSNGFANRFLWLAVRRSQLLPLGGKPVDLRGPGGKLAAAVAHAGDTDLVWLTEAATALWREELYGRLSALQNPVLSRATAQVRRLAMLYALLDLRRDVDACHLRAAAALWDYCVRSVAWIFGDSTGDPMADELLSMLNAAGEQGMSQTEIRDYFSKHARAARVGEALAALLRVGKVRWEAVPTKGRPAKRWFAVLSGTNTPEKSDRSDGTGAATTCAATEEATEGG